MMKKCVGVGTLVLAAMAVTVDSADALQRDDCEFRQEYQAEFGAGSETFLRVIAGSGSLEIVGRAGLTSVSMRATACASEEWMLNELEVRTQERDSELVIETMHPDSDDSRTSGRNRYARLDLRLEVPLGMAAMIRDGSGAAELSGLGVLGVNDGSGGLYIRDISGDLFVDDGSGELEISGVDGTVEVEDGSGSMWIEDVRGSVILSDGSGAVQVRDVTQDVRVAEMGSGALTVDEVGGDLVVRDGRNERISHSGVEGRVDIPEAKKSRRRRGGGR